MAKLTLVRLQGGYLSTASVNANQVLMEAALENTLSRDGSVPNVMSADIDMNSIGRITGLQDAVVGTEPVTLNQAGSLIGITTTTLTQDNIAAALWPQSAIETAFGATATELQFYYGDVRRYGAKLDSSTDDTAAFNMAVGSGYMGFCDAGIANIVGTIVLKNITAAPNGGQHLRLTSTVTLQRFTGSATTPMIHVYGHNNILEGNKATIRNNLYDHPDGIILLGPDPAEAFPGVTNTATQNNHISGFKVVGPENTANEKETGSPGVYIHSKARKKGDFVGDTTYKNAIWDMQILNCDIGLMFSSDANANSAFHIHFHQWITAAIMFHGSYGNDLYGIKMESPLNNVTPSTAKRFAIHFLGINQANETGTDATYLITNGWRNTIYGWAELPDTSGSDPNNNVALFTWNGTGGSGRDGFVGRNTLRFPGSTLSGGIGIAGKSDEAALGTNTVETPAVSRTREAIHDIKGYSFRSLDDDSDGGRGYFTKDNWVTISGRIDQIAESTQKDLFSIQGIGPNAAGAFIKVSWVGKADSIASAEAGEIMYGVVQNSTGVRAVEVILDSRADMGGASLFTFACTLAADPLNSALSRATVGITTSAPAGTNLFFLSWKAEIIVTETVGNADFDLNLKILGPAATT